MTPPVNWLMAAAVILLGAGCANTGTKRQAQPATGDHPEPGKGLVIFYREPRFGDGNGYAVRDFDEKPNGSKALSQPRIGALPNGSYFIYQATPGQHVFAGSPISTPSDWRDFLEESREFPNFYCCEMNVESNTTYYVQLRFTQRTSTPKLGVVDSQKGLAAIKNLKRVTLKASDK